MGYYTRYVGYIEGFDNKEEAEQFISVLKNETGYSFKAEAYNGLQGWELSFETVEDITWYDYDMDLKRITREYPNLLVELTGYGEESGDVWKARFRNGEHELVKANLVFPSFKKITYE